jgi:hypothetical protein
MTTPRVQQEEKPKDVLRSGIVKYEFSKNYLYNMKYQQGDLTEADIKARCRFWNKRGFFGTPTKKELEKRSKKMRELLSAIKDTTYEEITAIRCTMWLRHLNKKQLIVRNADKKDLDYALQIAPKTFKVNQSNNI